MLQTNKDKGFTLIELLIVVTLIGILSGIVITILNPNSARNKAKDGVRASNLAKLAQAVEAFNAGENAYPANQAALTAATTRYVQNWPTETGLTGNAAYIYTFGNGFACSSVQMGSNSAAYFKYINAWISGMGGDNTFAGKILRDCTGFCSTTVANQLSGCIKIG